MALPLKGLRVIDLTKDFAGPFCTMILSDLGAEVIRQLVQDSDILIESFRPGTLAHYNLDYPTLRRANKALVYCSISGFGQTGPYRDRPGYDIVAFAMSGIMSTTG